MAKKLSKAKRANLIRLVTEYALQQGRDARAKLQAQALMRDYCGRNAHRIIW